MGGDGGEGPPNVLLAPIVDSDYIETVTVLVNQSYADVHPELADNVGGIVMEVNAVLAKDPDNKKRYVLGRVMIYSDAYSSQFDQIGDSPEYFTDNHFIGNPNYGGTTIVYWVQPKIIFANLPAIFQKVGSSAAEFTKSVNGKKYGVAFIAEETGATALLGSEAYMIGFEDDQDYDYNSRIKVLLHELGHTFGLGAPEWYSLICWDNSRTLPSLSLNLKWRFYQDPMSSVYDAHVENKFAPFNTWMIAHNANHQLPIKSIVWAAQNLVKTQVKVVDTAGVPVPNTTVTVYGGVIKDVRYNYHRGTARNMETVLQTHVTDVNGMVSLDRDGDEWYARGIKASSNGKYAGAVITLIDLEDAFFRQGLNTYTLTLILREDSIGG